MTEGIVRAGVGTAAQVPVSGKSMARFDRRGTAAEGIQLLMDRSAKAGGKAGGKR